MEKYSEYILVTPMTESHKRMSAETLGKICTALGSDFYCQWDDRGGIAFFKLAEDKREEEK